MLNESKKNWIVIQQVKLSKLQANFNTDLTVLRHEQSNVV